MFQISFFKYHFPKEREHILFILMSSIMPMVFPVVIYGYENWTIKKVEHQGIDPFELWCWRRL